MQINYRPLPRANLLMGVLLGLFLICVPLWYFARWGWPQGLFAGKMLAAPLGGAIVLGLVVAAMKRNLRLQVDPMAFACDAAGLRIKRGDDLISFSWPEVGPVAVVRPKDSPSMPAISMKVRDARTGLREFTFAGNRLDLQGRPLADLVEGIEQVRRGAAAARAAASGRAAGL